MIYFETCGAGGPAGLPANDPNDDPRLTFISVPNDRRVPCNATYSYRGAVSE